MLASAVSWDYRVALDLFLGGVGVGAFILAVYFYYNSHNSFKKIATIGFVLGPILVGLGVIALMTELGKPLKMITTYINVNPTSVTSWGGFIQGLFIVLGLLIAYFAYKELKTSKQPQSFKFLLPVAAVFAVLVGIYHGLLLTSLGRPLWMNGLIPILFLLSSIITGSSLLVTIGAFLSSKNTVSSQQQVAATIEQPRSSQMATMLASMIGLQIVLIVIWRITLNSTGLHATENYTYMMDQFGIYWWSLAIVIGLLVPLVISLYLVIKKSTFNIATALFITLTLLIGSYAFKHIIIYAGQMPIPVLS